MNLPLTPVKRGAIAAATLAASALVGLLVSSPAGAHPGPVDTSGGHYCTQAQNASGLCAPPTYHRHDPDGGIRVVTPGPEAAQLTGQPATGGTATQPFDPATTPSTTAPPPAAPVAAPVAAPAAAPLADTGPIDMRIAVFGFLLSAMGLAAVVANRRIPLPVILELERAPATRESAP